MPSPQPPPNQPSDVAGLWQCVRSSEPGGLSLWLQTETLFFRLQLPAGASGAGAGGASASELVGEETPPALAAQSATVGVLSLNGGEADWLLRASYQPAPQESGKRSHFTWDGLHLMEADADGEMLHWRRLADAGDGRCVLALREGADAWGGNCTGRRFLAVNGEYFMYFRDRPHPLTDGPQIVRQWPALNRDERRQVLDCEMSFGQRMGGTLPWQVELSTLPERLGTSLFPPGQFPVRVGEGTCRQRLAEQPGESTFVWDVLEWGRAFHGFD